MTAHRSVVLGIAGLLALTLAGCTSTTPPDSDETYVQGPVETAPSDPVTPNPIEPDTTLIIRATAIALNGALLNLELQVHGSVRFDDIANQTLAQGLVEDCAGGITAEQQASERWSLTRVNLTAIPVEGSTEWPQGAIIQLLPAADPLRSAGRGIVVGDPATGSAACVQDKSFASAGKGAFALGIPGDADVNTAWSGLRFGFVTTDVSLTDCSIELTDLGRSLGGGTGSWADSISGTECTTGGAE